MSKHHRPVVWDAYDTLTGVRFDFPAMNLPLIFYQCDAEIFFKENTCICPTSVNNKGEKS